MRRVRGSNEEQLIQVDSWCGRMRRKDWNMKQMLYILASRFLSSIVSWRYRKVVMRECIIYSRLTLLILSYVVFVFELGERLMSIIH